MSEGSQDGTSSEKAVVWVVDDVEANHQLVRRSLPEGWASLCELVGFVSALETLGALEAALRSVDGLPDVVFMDYFLGDLQGDTLTRRVRAEFQSRKLAGPFIVGHSSSPPASFEIVRAGGDIAIEKDRRLAYSKGVRSLFPDLAALRGYAGRARKAVP